MNSSTKDHNATSFVGSGHTSNHQNTLDYNNAFANGGNSPNQNEKNMPPKDISAGSQSK